MKKITCLFFAFLLLLCGCSQSIPEQPAGVGSFSYKSDRAYYADFMDDPGIKESGFVNVKRSKVNSAEDAVALAKKDLLIKVKKKFKKFWIFIVGEEGRTQLSRFALRFFEAAAIQLNCVC